MLNTMETFPEYDIGSAESGTMVDLAAPNMTQRHLSTHTRLYHRLITTF
jgi:hypothetical protein